MFTQGEAGHVSFKETVRWSPVCPGEECVCVINVSVRNFLNNAAAKDKQRRSCLDLTWQKKGGSVCAEEQCV